MSEAEAPAPSRGRRSRDAEEQGRRARRYNPSENDEGVDFHLWVDERKLDRNQYQYRWVRATPQRLQRLENQDWDIVPAEEIGFQTDRHAAVNGKEDTRFVFMRKYKDWFEADHKARQNRISEQMKRAARGEEIIQERTADGQSAGGLTAAHAYMPRGQNEL